MNYVDGMPMTADVAKKLASWDTVKTSGTGPAGSPPERASVNVLRECIELQNKKSSDYQNKTSNILQADYYPSGCLTILEIMHAKLLRMRSVMEAMQNDPTYKPNFESLEDSAKDLINYASFYVSYSRGTMEGQSPDRDFLNRRK